MKAMVVESEVQADGRLRLDVPTNLPPGKVEIVLVIQPLESPAPPYPTLEGRWHKSSSYDFNTYTTPVRFQL
jgi:hypothetical protein